MLFNDEPANSDFKQNRTPLLKTISEDFYRNHYFFILKVEQNEKNGNENNHSELSTSAIFTSF